MLIFLHGGYWRSSSSKDYSLKDLQSYSPVNLVLANVGNAFHWLYVVNLPVGPIWFMHSFQTLVTAMMLFWYVRYRRAS